MKTLEINIEELKCLQKFGYQTVYYKEENIKHKRKKIEDYNYNTKKSQLIYYKNEFTHDNNFSITFIYKADNGKYFRRIFNSLGEQFELVRESIVLGYINNDKTLF